jgi:ubiquinone/menaquinone biosynthesis C-methylase UbiE
MEISMELSPHLYKYLVRPEWMVNQCINRILSNNIEFENKKVLDFGSGIGSNCFMFKNSDYIGIDCCEKRIQYARDLHPEYDFRIVKKPEIPIDHDSIDYILILSVIHHIIPEDLAGYLTDFKRILNSNGKIIVLEPCFINHAYLTNRFIKIADRGKYVRFWYEYPEIFIENDYIVKILDI